MCLLGSFSFIADIGVVPKFNTVLIEDLIILLARMGLSMRKIKSCGV